MKKTSKTNRLLSLVLCICMALSLLPGMPLTASAAAAVSYIDCSWDGSKVVQTQKQVSEYTVVTSGTTAWNAGWYVVTGEVTIDSRVTVSGDVHLILADGAVLTAQKGIAVQMGSLDNPNSLTIYAQSANAETMGKLIAVSDENNNAGIGGGYEGAGGTVTITGGTVSAQGGAYGAGIGGGFKGNGGDVTIIGGKVTANGGTEAAGIGGGSSRTGGTVTIYGGVVVANGGYQAAAIGGGSSGHGGSLHIYGGSVTATGGHQGAGIGGGMGAAARAVKIFGGTVTAIGGTNAAGIGGGDSGDGGTVTISGGTVTASGGDYSAGIGSGATGSWNSTSGTVTISGGTVTATGGYGGAGIGGGTQPGTSVGGSGSVMPGLGGAGNLAAGGAGATVTIVGGNVKATAGLGASKIGAGLKGKTSGTLTDGSGNSLTLHTLILSGAATDTAVTGVTGIGSYGLTDVKTLDTNRLYFYLPAGQNVTAVTAGDVDYICRRGTTLYSAHTTTEEGDNAPTCTEPGICTVCGEIVVDALGHTGGIATCSKQAICEVCGEPYGDTDCYNHVGETYVEYDWHPYDDGTCYVYATLYCAGCDENIDSNGDYAEQTGSVEAIDCQKPGSVTYSITLTLNGEEYTDSETFEVKSHNHTALNNDGFCSACGGYQMPELDPGEWSYDDVYLVYNAGQLFWVADYVNNVSNEINVKLMADITVPVGMTWTPIMNFYGTFDGNFKTVSGLYVKSEGEQVGMFGGGGYSYGTIKNLHLTDSYFEGTQYVGGIAGYHAGTTENCAVDGTVTVVGNNSVGALVGSLAGNVYNCFAYAPTLVGYYNSSYSNVENSYYLTETDDGNGGKTAQQFAGGEVAYLLQGEQTEHVWGQTIGEDDYPLLGKDVVYLTTDCQGNDFYSNSREAGQHVYDENGKCTLCGETTEPDFRCELNAMEVSCDAEVLLRMKMIIGEDIIGDDNAYVVMTKNGKDTIFTTADLRAKGTDAKGRYILEQGIASGEMTYDITLKIYNGKGELENIYDYVSKEVSTSVTRSVLDYAERIFTLGTQEQKDLIAALITYGGYSQLYFGKDTSNPAYNVLTKQGMEIPAIEDITVDDFTQEISRTGDAIGITQTNSRVYLDSAIYMRVYFVLDAGKTIDGYTFTLTHSVNNVEKYRDLKPVYDATNNRYYVDIENIAAAYLDYMYTITVTDGTGTYTVQTSAMAWAKLALNAYTDINQINMIKAMYFYNQAANEFFGK